MARTIMLVDDEFDSLEPIRILLNDEFNVLVAESGKDALKMLETMRAEIVVSDQRMPGMTGVQLLNRVRELYPNTVRIILSAYTDFDAMTMAINEGRVYRYLAKPWNVDSLRVVINQALEWKDLRAAQGKLNADLADAHTALTERTRELEQANDRIINHEKLAAVGRFAAEMVHEMNNYLQGIFGLHATLSMAMKEQMEQLDELKFQARTLADIALHISDFSKGAGLPFSPKVSDPVAPAQEVLRVCSHHPTFKGVKINMTYDDDVPEWNLDTRQLKHLLMNLLKNSAKALKDNIPIDLKISYNSQLNALQYSVIDHGKGISPHLRERIFEPFYTSSDQDGTGLGLSICKQVAKSHKGELICQETKGGGATFVLTIPECKELES